MRHLQGRGNIKGHRVFAEGGGGLRMAAPYLRRLATGISPWRSGFNYKPPHVGICGGRSDKEFSLSTSVYPVSNDPRLLHAHSFNYGRR